MRRKLMACPRCGAFYSGGRNAKQTCDNCGEILEEVNISYDSWMAMNEEEKKKYKKEYRIKNQCNEGMLKNIKAYEDAPESDWETALGCMGWVIIGAGIIGAVGLLLSGIWIGVIVSLAAGMMCAAGCMVLKEVAVNVRTARNMLNKFIRENEKC